MSTVCATVIEEGGVVVTSGEAGSFVIEDVVFPPSHRHAVFEPPQGYVVVVLEGALAKTFRTSTHDLRPASVVTMPPGARHATQFSRAGARVVIVRPRSAEEYLLEPSPGTLRDLRLFADGETAALAWKLSAELKAGDLAWQFAAEGLALELIAALSRVSGERRRERHPPAWLASVDELLGTGHGEQPALGELAALVGVHPAHLARVFREHRGMTVGAYVRRVRLDWAASQLASTDEPIAALAASAGFADQSHFTRAFKLYTGRTPGRYREGARPERRAARAQPPADSAVS
jgi:AraC family transcriptional regulator